MSEKEIRFIFMLGRPGCGKSYLFNKVFVPALLKKNIRETERIDDFPILQRLLDEDKDCRRHLRKDGGFAVTDWTIVDDVLREMDALLKKKEKSGKAVFVEFARDDYRKALVNFSDHVRERSLLLYIWAPLEACLKSNRSRFENKQNIDDHIVPEDLMRSYYKTDDLEKMFLKESPSDAFYRNWNLKFFDNSDRALAPEKKQNIFLSLLEGDNV